MEKTIKNKMITSVFANKDRALHAMYELGIDGLDKSDMYLYVPENASDINDYIKIVEKTKFTEGTALGVGLGGASGAFAAGLTSVGLVAVTGGLGLVASGPIVAALAGAGVGGTVGGVVGGLIGLSYSEPEAKFVNQPEVNKGAVLLTVKTNQSNEAQVEQQLKILNAKEITMH